MHEVIIHRVINDDGVIEIAQDHTSRSLYFGNDAKQSSMLLSDPNYLLLTYTRAMMAGLMFNPRPANALLIGLGGGSLAKYLLSKFDTITLDIVENRRTVAQLAYEYFGLPAVEQIQIFINDAYEFLNKRDGRYREYDFLFVDAFDHDGISESIKHEQFFDHCKQRLSHTGVLVVNLWSASVNHYTYMLGIIETVFENRVLTLPVPDKGNTIIFAVHDSNVFDKSWKKDLQHMEQTFELTLRDYRRQIKRNNRWRKISRLFI